MILTMGLSLPEQRLVDTTPPPEGGGFIDPETGDEFIDPETGEPFTNPGT